MTTLFSYLPLLAFITMPTFKSNQLKYQRVKTAYDKKYELINTYLKNIGMDVNSLNIFIRAFKHEKKLELWGSDAKSDTFTLIKEYDFCSSSGKPGPKRKQGDLQIPEGIYYIDRFNPLSKFHLSLGINYPNRSDKILGADKPGGDIFIHGNCVTIGCIPITDDKIEELYVYAVEAKNNGQNHIPVHIYPFKMNEDAWKTLEIQFRSQHELLNFWKRLKPVYERFMQTRKLTKVSISDTGQYFLN